MHWDFLTKSWTKSLDGAVARLCHGAQTRQELERADNLGPRSLVGVDRIVQQRMYLRSKALPGDWFRG